MLAAFFRQEIQQILHVALQPLIQQVRTLLVGILCILLALAGFALGGIFLLVSLYNYLAPVMGIAEAALIVGALAMVAAALFFVAGLYRLRPPRG